ncbi:MAG TPA: hypothetical protein PLD20_00115 [Blastocatellia bacterium]|nr:hypothetical protein [Blastocatellia bacterium]HMV81968.1 hypothetical protein [Blastocatellia bacterium]HMY70484.1 hypothetical protein [Blastocatellia bacterium]HMZ16338.1 hypothetical protein [Blastocatellia bacterium]HNG28863.1 hypothetical protein [Blastocatellia bacterium]
MLLLKSIGMILLLANAVGLLLMLRAISKPERYNNFVKPIMAMELVRSPDDITHVLADVGKFKQTPTPEEFFKTGLRWDGYIIIPFYWGLLMTFSFLLSRHQFASAKWLGIASGLSTTVAAAFDYLENHRMKLALDNHSLAAGVRQASLYKWGLLFVAFGLLASMFLWRWDSVVVIGTLYLLTALIGLIGLRQDQLIEWSFLPLMAGGAAFGAMLLFAPQRFLAGFS